MSETKIAAEIAISTGYALAVERFPDEIAPAFAAAKKLSMEIIRPTNSGDEPMLVYVIGRDGTVAS